MSPEGIKMQIDRIKIAKAEYNDIKAIEEIYNEAFPKYERKPFSIILGHNESGAGSILKITLDGALVGFFFTYFYRDFAMVDYFAIQKDYRNQGIGEIAIGLLREEYRDKRIYLEIEDPDSSEMAERRLGFYKRCGFLQAGTYVNLFSVDMELLTLGDFPVSFEEYFALYVSMLGESRAVRNVIERK